MTQDAAATARLNDFKRDGYIAVQPLFDAGQVLEIKQQVDRFLTYIVPGMPETQVYYEDKHDKNSLKQIQQLFQYDAWFHDLMFESVIRQLAEEMLQDEVVPVNMQYFNKPPGMGLATPPHQDGYYFHLTPCEAVTGWLALDDVDEENGCIHYVRGSHQSEQLRPHGATGVLGFSQGISDFGTIEDQANTVAFPGPAGSFLLHHAKTIHFADANHSSIRSRRALGFIYYARRARADQATHAAYQQALAVQLKQAQKI